MRRALPLAFLLLLVFSLVACDSFPEDSGLPGDEEQSALQAAVDPIQRGGDSLVRAIALLSENYVERVEPPTLMASAQKGAWQALAEAGVPPVDLEVPREQQLQAETLPGFRQRYLRVASKYSSKVDPTWLAYQMIRTATDSLGDCHTGFMTPKQVHDQAQRLAGTTKFGGIGVILRRIPNEGFAVVEVFDDTPAQKAGMKRGDLLVAVDGDDVTSLGIEQVVEVVRGAEGAPVKVTVHRAGVSGPIDLTITRAAVSAPNLTARVLNGNVGYVRLYSFPDPLTSQLDGALKEMERRGVNGVVLDLRDNSGGQLDVVTKVTSRFVPDGPIFRQVAQNGNRTVYRADGSYWQANRALVVLVNGGTGSGGEILASAVKEHRSGLVIGTKTSGCVSTGQMFPLPDGSALEIATNRVISGVGSQELNKVGIQPDEVVETAPSDLADDRDPQLARAVELVLEG